MAHNNYFQFKQFRIKQEKSAMRVGTDGVLLGAWTKITGNENSLLDVGTGTGLIALMLAQRSEAKITAVEIETEAAYEALENVKNSPWSKKMNIVHASFQNFASGQVGPFDLIVSNPPFFIDNSKNADAKRNIARHTDFLSISELVFCSEKLLSETGRMAVILPEVAANQFIDAGKKTGLYANHITEVKPELTKKANRFLIELSRKNSETISDSLCIHNPCKSGYTSDYMNLTREYYLNF